MGRRILVFLVFLALTAAMVVAGFVAGRYLMDKILFPGGGSAAPQVKAVEPEGNRQLDFLSKLWRLVRGKSAEPGLGGPVAVTAPGGDSSGGTSGGSGAVGGSGPAGDGSGTAPGPGATSGSGQGAGTAASGKTGAPVPVSTGPGVQLAVDAGLNVFEVYVAQVAAYRTPSLASDRVQALEGYGWPAYLDRSEPDNLIKVRVGVFGSLAPARSLSDTIAAAGFKSIPLMVVLGQGGETFRGNDRALLESMRDSVKQTSYVIWEEAAAWGDQYQKKASLSQVAERGLKFRSKIASLATSLKGFPEDSTAAPVRAAVMQMLGTAETHFAALAELKSKPADNAAYFKAARTFAAVIEQYALVVRNLK